MDPKTARERRYNTICQLVGLRSTDRVLDVGCGEGLSFEAFNRENDIVGLDIDPVQRMTQDNFRFICGDVALMRFFRDREFDVVVCIGVLNRVAPYEKLKHAAREIRRVGRAYAVVVPHMLTFIEPHSQLPLWQFSPQIFRNFSRLRESMYSDGENSLPAVEGESLFYLRAQEWRSLFPEATILSYEHMPLGLVRNYVIYTSLRTSPTSEVKSRDSDDGGNDSVRPFS